LNTIPGTKVVFLDSCHSGGFIGKEISENEISSTPEEFNRNVIDVFASRDLTGSQYQVLTSCLSTQTCWGLAYEGDYFGLFSYVLCVNCGYDYYSHPYYADANENREITLQEAYISTDQGVSEGITYFDLSTAQDTQVYPVNSNFVIIEEYGG